MYIASPRLQTAWPGSGCRWGRDGVSSAYSRPHVVEGTDLDVLPFVGAWRHDLEATQSIVEEGLDTVVLCQYSVYLHNANDLPWSRSRCAHPVPPSLLRSRQDGVGS